MNVNESKEKNGEANTVFVSRRCTKPRRLELILGTVPNVWHIDRPNSSLSDYFRSFFVFFFFKCGTLVTLNTTCSNTTH